MNLRRITTVITALALPAFLLPSTASAADSHRHTQEALDAVVAEGTPGVIAAAQVDRRTWRGVAGVADVERQRPRRADERFRVASITKPFTAVTMLELEAAGELSLEDSVEKWLPGVVRGEGYDARRIKIRHLLNHTSGIFNYNDDVAFRARYGADQWEDNRLNHVPPGELVDIALQHPAVFQPGAAGRWKYSDTNYILAGMIIERASGTSYEKAVRQLVIRPLGLTGTSLPGDSPYLPRPHATHYSTFFEDGPARDVTEFNPTVAWSAGQVVSTTTDINRFLALLLAGKVLPPAQQRKMFDAVPVDGDDQHGGPRDLYGLGIRRFELAEGCWAWGHGGMIPGSASRAVGTEGGRHVFTMNRNGDWGDQALEDATLRAEFC